MPVMRFTNTITSSLSTSVMSVKFLRLHIPKMASTFRPGTMAFNVEVLSPFMFCAMISAPASPKPRANSEPILMIVFSRTTVSIESSWRSLSDFSCLEHREPNGANNRCRRARMPSPSVTERRTRANSSVETPAMCVCVNLRASDFCVPCSAFRLSSSPMVIAAKGLFLILSTFAIILSIGWSTYLLASLEKVTAPMPNKRQMNNVCPMLRAASSFEPSRRSNTNIQ
mmetsp:Transcript_55733/g.156395  ORF Transcript_55733/g.156395 Transcript_55733/m.156395 type:complete len:227 (-) Transcript_55733:93-773(-)